MKRKLKIADITQALERASRIPTLGTDEERAGQITDDSAGSTDEKGGTSDELVIYESKHGLRISVRYSSDTLWMTQRQMADLFGVGVPGINKHLSNIYVEGELDPDSTISKMEIVTDDGRRRSVNVYSLDAVISVGYRVSSKQATQFRMWATSVLIEFARKGYALDDERLKAPQEQDYFAELRERIRDIRASEANVYKELRSILALCLDYDPKSHASANFYAFTQNQLLWATTSMTAAELILSRANSKSPNMGLTVWPKQQIRQADAAVAKNYLGEVEIKELNRLTGMLLDFFEDRTQQRQSVSMSDLEDALDRFLQFNERAVLTNLGRVSHQRAVDHAKSEYKKFAALRREQRQALE